MCWPPPGIQGAVGTAAGNLFHVHWASPGGKAQPAAAATAIVSAPPPPVRKVAALAHTAGGARPGRLAHTAGGGRPGRLAHTAGGAHAGQPTDTGRVLPACRASLLLATVSAPPELGGVFLWSSAEAGAPLMRVMHPSGEEATCVALAEVAPYQNKPGEQAHSAGIQPAEVKQPTVRLCAVGFADGERGRARCSLVLKLARKAQCRDQPGNQMLSAGIRLVIKWPDPELA
jgi:hypothetical protein